MSTSTQSPRIFGNKSGLHNDAIAEGLARAVNKTNSEDKLRKLVDDSRVRVEHAKRIHATQARFSTIRLPALAKLADKDGQNHFNLSTAATTALGEAMSLTSDLSFTHSHLGPVRCLEGIWGYMLSKPRAKAFLEKPYKSMGWLRKHATLMEDAPNIRLVIADALWQKVSQYKEVVDVLKESTLPFDVYVRSFDGLLKRTFFAGWYIVLVEEIRRSIKSGKEPNLFQFADDEIYTELKDAPREKQQAYIKDFLNELFAPELVVTQRNQAKREREREAAAREEGTRQRQPNNEGVQENKKPEAPVTKKDPATKEERRRAHEELMAKHRADKQARLAKNGTVTDINLQSVVGETQLNLPDITYSLVYRPQLDTTANEVVDERDHNDPRGRFEPTFEEINYSAENIALNPLIGLIPEEKRKDMLIMTGSSRGAFIIPRDVAKAFQNREPVNQPQTEDVVLEEVKAIEDEVKAEAQAEAESDPFLRTATEAPVERDDAGNPVVGDPFTTVFTIVALTDMWVPGDIEVHTPFGSKQLEYTTGPLAAETMEALAQAGLPMEMIDELCMINVTNAAPANPTAYIMRREDLPKQDI